MRKLLNLKKLTAIFVFLLTLSIFATERGSLTILSEPSDAHIYIDDEYVGKTPLNDYMLDQGEYSVRLIDEVTQVTATENIKVTPDSSIILNVPLQKDFGTIKVTTEPEGADVYFTSHIGKTPLKDERIVPGAYTLEIKMPNSNYKSIKKNIVISPDMTVNVTEDLPKEKKFKISQIALRLGLAAAAGVTYTVGFNSMYNDDVGTSKAMLIVGSTCVIGLTVVSFVF